MSARSRLVELRQELEYRRCAADPVYFFENHWHISHPAEGRIKFELWDAQKDGLRHWMDNRYSLTLKARQLGWSTLVAAYAFWLAFFHADRNIIMVSRTEREAVSLLKKAKYGYKHMPKWMLQRGPTQAIEHQQRIEFDNGSKVVSMPSASDPARGESASLVIVDEWAFLPNPEEAWASIEPVADVGGRIIGLSTANGWGEFFHTMWVGAETGTNQFKTFFAPWSANEQRDDNWYKAKQASMLPWILAQEYPTDPDEAFIRSGRAVFDLEALERAVVPQEFELGFLHDLGGVRSFEWRPAQHRNEFDLADPLRVWQHPEEDLVYTIGADVAEGLAYGDYSSAHVIRQDTGEVVAHWHGHISADQFGQELFKLGMYYNWALVGVEANNHGLTTVTELKRLEYPRIYRRRSLNNVRGKVPQTQYGWSTTRVTKPLMIDELGKALRDEDVHLYCASTLAELRTYVRDDKGGMSGSPHDDRVISLAIAVQMLDHVFAPEYAHEAPVGRWSMDWWRTVNSDQTTSQTSDKWVIGSHSARR